MSLHFNTCVKISWSFVCLFLLAQCTPQGTKQPKAPQETYLYSDMQIQDEKHLSVVNIPLEMPISELEKQINTQINGLIYDDNSYENDGNDNLKAKVWKLSPIKIQAIDSTFLFDVPLKIWVSAGYKVSPLGITMSGYKDTEFSIRIRFVSKISVTPDWRLVITTFVDSYDWITEPVIKVAGFNIPIKSMVSRTLSRNYESITKTIDKQVEESIELKKYVRQAWDLARTPFLMSDEYKTWLVVVPTGMVMTPLTVRNRILRTTIGIRGYTQTVTSFEKPEIRGNNNLPPLQVVDKIPGEFRVGLISTITYKEASRMARESFIGEKFSSGKYSVEVTSIDLFGQNENLVIKAGLKGSLNGVIYMKGKPHYDPDTKNLSLKSLDYDLETRNVILKTAGWLLQSKFSKMMEKQFVFSMGEQISEAQKTVQSTLTNNTLAKGIVLNGTLKELTPDKVYLTPEHIYSVVFATGQVTLRIEGLQ
jgi:hypothetical protein